MASTSSRVCCHQATGWIDGLTGTKGARGAMRGGLTRGRRAISMVICLLVLVGCRTSAEVEGAPSAVEQMRAAIGVTLPDFLVQTPVMHLNVRGADGVQWMATLEGDPVSSGVLAAGAYDFDTRRRARQVWSGATPTSAAGVWDYPLPHVSSFDGEPDTELVAFECTEDLRCDRWVIWSLVGRGVWSIMLYGTGDWTREEALAIMLPQGDLMPNG